MKFLNWLFPKKQQEVKFSQLSTWLVTNTEFSLAEETQQFRESLVSLDTAIKDIENVDLIKIKIEPRALNRIKGNRSAYVTALKTLYKEVKTPEKLDAQSLEKWSKDTEQQFNKFSQKTIKNYHILKTVVGKELDDTVKILRAVEELRKKIMKRVELANLKAIEEIHQKIQDIDATLIKGKESKHRLEALRKQQTHLIEEEMKLQKEIERLEASEVFKEYTTLGLRVEELNKMLARERAELISQIIPLERALKKFARDTRNTDIDPFLKNKDAFVLKNEQKTLEMLDKLEKNVAKKEDTEKSLEQLRLLKQTVPGYCEKVRAAKIEIQHTEKKLAENKYEEEIHAILPKLNQITNVMTKINEEENKIEKKTIQEDILEIEKALKTLGHNVTIKYDTLA